MIRRRETGLIPVQDEQTVEQTVGMLRRHARVLTGPFLVLALTSAALGFFDAQLPEAWMRLTLWVAGAVIVLALVVVPLLAWLGGRVVVTTRRIIIYNGLIVRSRREILLARVSDVTVRRTPLQAVMRSGNMLISLGGEQTVRVRDIPRADLVAAALLQLAASNEPVALQRTRDKAEWANDVFGVREQGLLSA
jgi:membrane protein YdbS with pleckstrin-like domain